MSREREMTNSLYIQISSYSVKMGESKQREGEIIFLFVWKMDFVQHALINRKLNKQKITLVQTLHCKVRAKDDFYEYLNTQVSRNTCKQLNRISVLEIPRYTRGIKALIVWAWFSQLPNSREYIFSYMRRIPLYLKSVLF